MVVQTPCGVPTVTTQTRTLTKPLTIVGFFLSRTSSPRPSQGHLASAAEVWQLRQLLLLRHRRGFHGRGEGGAQAAEVGARARKDSRRHGAPEAEGHGPEG